MTLSAFAWALVAIGALVAGVWSAVSAVRQRLHARRRRAQILKDFTAEYSKLWSEYISEHPPAPLPPHVTPKQVIGVIADLLKSYSEQPDNGRALVPEMGPVTYDQETQRIRASIPCDLETIGRYVEMSYEDGESHDVVTLWLKERGCLNAFVEVAFADGSRRWALRHLLVEVG